jgi:hypothetical protein
VSYSPHIRDTVRIGFRTGTYRKAEKVSSELGFDVLRKFIPVASNTTDWLRTSAAPALPSAGYPGRLTIVLAGGVCRRQNSGEIAICLSPFRPLSRFISLPSAIWLMQRPGATTWAGSVDGCFNRDAEGHVTTIASMKANRMKEPENFCGEICIANLRLQRPRRFGEFQSGPYGWIISSSEMVELTVTKE